MKKIILFSATLFLFFSNSHAQVNVDKTLDIFHRNAVPYLKQLVEVEYGTKLDEKAKDSRDLVMKNAAYARFESLKIESNKIISSEVKDQVKREKTLRKEWLVAFVSNDYRKHFSGLQKKFYDESFKEALKL